MTSPLPRYRTLRILTAAQGVSDAEARARYLDTACAGEPELRQRVDALLRSGIADSSLFHGEEADMPLSSDAVDDVVGSTIGRYRLLRQIGQGGFGSVFLAEQTEPIHRRVAIKVIKAGMDTRSVVARFEAERQALALMDHPNIATVLDAGATELGRPYFVMELVAGIPITEFCDHCALAMSDRLQLFMQVCSAVQHAHQKAIIHRDLKPSNVLVTVIDGRPVPKIIDFGVAKALGQPLTERTLYTAVEAAIGTPAYMSPEQTSLSSLDVDTRSDIYSLGALLYELLTGVTPIDTETFLRAGLDEVHRMIRETEPPKPSTRLRTLGEKLTEVAQQRQLEPSVLSRLLHGELDWIVMKALEKDRERRYETVTSLVDDLRRHLDHRPVQAGPPGTLYRARKFVRRHRVGVGLSALVLTSLLLGLSAALAGFSQARQERNRAVHAEREAERERNHAERLAAEAAVEKGQAKLDAGDSWGLLDLVAAYELAEHHPVLRASIGRRWSMWHAQWDTCTLAVRHLGQPGAAAASSPCTPSPDFRRYATVHDWPTHNASRNVMVYDMLSGEPVAGPLPHGGIVTACAFSPDGRRLATVTQTGTLHVWDCRSGRAACPPWDTGIPELNRLTFSASGRLLAGCSLEHGGPQAAQAVLLHLDEPGGARHVFSHRYPTGGARFSPDEELLAISCKPDLQLWQTRDHQPACPPIAVTTSHVADFSGDGMRLALDPAGSGGTGILDTSTLQVQQVLKRTGARANVVGLSHDGALLGTFDWGYFLELWRVDEPGAPYARLKTKTRLRGGFTFSPDDAWVAVGERAGTVHVLRTQDGSRAAALHTLPTPRPSFLANGVLAAHTDGLAYFWDLAAPPLPGAALPHDALAYALAFDASGRHLAVGGEDELRLWAWQPTPQLEQVVPMPGRVIALTYCAEDRCFVAFSDDGSLIAVQPDTGAAEARGHIGRGRNLMACMSPDARKLAFYRYFEVFLADARTGNIEWLDEAGGTESAAFRPDSEQLALGSASWRVFTYSIGGQRTPLTGEPAKLGGQIEGLAYHPDGRVLAASVGSRIVCLVEPESGRRLFTEYEPSLSRIDLLCFSPNGRLLAVAGRGSTAGYGIELWHLDPEQGLFQAGTPLPSRQPIWSLAFSPDSRILAAGGAGSTRLWRLPPEPNSVHDVQSQTWATLGFRVNPQGERVLLDTAPPNLAEIRARLSGDAIPVTTRLEAALDRPPEEALEELRRLLAQHPASTVYRKLLGRLHARQVSAAARQNLWEIALGHADEVVRLGYDDARTGYFRALVYLERGDLDGYRAACEDMIEQYRTSQDPAALTWVGWSAALAPGAISSDSDLVSRLRAALNRLGGEDAEGYRFFLGAVLARTGYDLEAIAEFDRLARHLAAGTYTAFPSAYPLYWLALCHARLEHQAEALHYLDAATSDHQSLLQSTQDGAASAGTLSWDERLVLEMLRKEAEAALSSLVGQAGAS